MGSKFQRSLRFDSRQSWRHNRQRGQQLQVLPQERRRRSKITKTSLCRCSQDPHARLIRRSFQRQLHPCRYLPFLPRTIPTDREAHVEGLHDVASERHLQACKSRIPKVRSFPERHRFGCSSQQSKRLSNLSPPPLKRNCWPSAMSRK